MRTPRDLGNESPLSGSTASGSGSTASGSGSTASGSGSTAAGPAEATPGSTASQAESPDFAELPAALTLLDLVSAVADVTTDEAEIVATVLHMLHSGRVRLTGNFREDPRPLFTP